MVNALHYLSGRYITAERLPPYERRLTAVITAAGPELMEASNEEKLVLALKSTSGKKWPQKMVLNVTNGKLLVDAFGKETSDWTDCAIEAWQAPTQFGAKTVPGIKINPLNGAGAAQPAIETRPIPSPVPEASRDRTAINTAVPLTPRDGSWDVPGGDDLDDEIPL